VPGSILLSRYRLIERVGGGGMGEVYRADDLKLGQTVALKFLPAEFAHDPERLARFLAEVRIARQVSHPNVCRVYDIQELDGAHFLSMEFIDGEDLASLLRRIGRLPRDKALELSRQLCTGLAAAHERGVLHRDLKPANVMIDGRGTARIADFGLADVRPLITGAESRAGTPAYMAPEQLLGQEVTARSDIYSLGLVLYEMFTGKPAMTGKTLQALMTQKLDSQLTLPSELVRDLDPAIEAVILRCLAKDAASRPSSALAVAAALPGGDPLAAALLAGETPSPEIVAAAGTEGSLRPALAIPVLALVLFGVMAISTLAGKATLLSFLHLDKSPPVLADRAETIIERLGYPCEGMSRAWGFTEDHEVLRSVRARTDVDRWEALANHRQPFILYWHRLGDGPLEPVNVARTITPTDPPPITPGMLSVTLDPSGRLRRFDAVPPERPDSTRAAGPVNWDPIFAEAGLSMDALQRVEPRWIPRNHCEERAAWVGRAAGFQDSTVRVEAGAFGGRVAFVRVVDPSSTPGAAEPREDRPVAVANTVLSAIVVLILFSSAWLARRNVRLRRGDRRGATRLAYTVAVFQIFRMFFQADLPSTLNELLQFFTVCLALSLLIGGWVFVLYLGIEPYIRKLWPTTIVSWTRFLAGNVRDALVGRDILVGTAVAVLLCLLGYLRFLAEGSLGRVPPKPQGFILETLSGPGNVASYLLAEAIDSFWLPLAMTLFVLLMKMVMRNLRVAVLSAFLLLTVTFTVGDRSVIGALGIALTIGAQLFLLTRFGLLALLTFYFNFQTLRSFPITNDFSAWYSAAAVCALSVPIVLGSFGFFTSLGTKTLFKRDPVAEAS